jgi:nitroreductase
MVWDMTEDGFAGLVADAVRAPSMHNTQPWRFRFTGPTIEVLVDPDRRLPVADPTGRAARVACGAAVFNLRLALAVAGTPARVAVWPDPDLVARLAPAPPRPATPLERRLHAAIPRRHSYRYPFADVPVPAAARIDLVEAAGVEGGWLHLAEAVTEAEAVTDLIHDADRILRTDPAYLAELNAWTNRQDVNGEGITRDAGGPEPDQHELLTRRDFGAATGPRPFERDPLLAVLGAAGDLPADDVVAGMALQRVLLTATDLGLVASLFTQPIDEPGSRKRLQAACHNPYPPHAVLRIGYGEAPHPTGRRAVTETIAPPR